MHRGTVCKKKQTLSKQIDKNVSSTLIYRENDVNILKLLIRFDVSHVTS